MLDPSDEQMTKVVKELLDILLINFPVMPNDQKLAALAIASYIMSTSMPTGTNILLDHIKSIESVNNLNDEDKFKYVADMLIKDHMRKNSEEM